MEQPFTAKKLLIEIQCFGNIQFWAQFQKSSGIIFESHEHFQKSGYRNRYFILGSHGPLLLTVPVIGGRETREIITSVRIDNHKKWRDQHWKALSSCYNKSPFFYHYGDGLREIIFNHHDLLWDLDLSIFQWVKKQLRISGPVDFTTAFHKESGEISMCDLRGKMKTANREDVASYLPYHQVFGNNFQQNLSILDLLFNLGPESSSYLLNFNKI